MVSSTFYSEPDISIPGLCSFTILPENSLCFQGVRKGNVDPKFWL